MTKTTRNLVISMALSVAPVGIPATEANASTAAPVAVAPTHVRTHSPELASVIRQAAERSTTFRSLVDAIDASDGIVYVEPGDCGRGVRACLVTVTAAGPARILQVRVDPRKADWDLMGSIGHELRHVVEVLGSPAVTSTAAMFFFYEREGRRVSHGFETDGAVRAGNRVRAEVRRADAAQAQ